MERLLYQAWAFGTVFGSTRPAQAAAEKGDPRHRVSRSMSPTLMILMSIVERV